MTGKRIAGVLFLFAAAYFIVIAVLSLSAGDGPALGDPSGLGVSRAVGTFLPSIVTLIVGLWLLKKPGPTRRA